MILFCPVYIVANFPKDNSGTVAQKIWPRPLINMPHPLINDVVWLYSCIPCLYWLYNFFFHYLCYLYLWSSLPIRLNSLIHLLSKMAFSFLLLCCWCYTSHLVEIASNCQLTRMAGKFHVRASKVVGTHQEPKLFVWSFYLLKSVFELLLLFYECQRGLN